MGKITLEQICNYLPYELKFKSEMDKPFHEYGVNPIHTCIGVIELFGECCLNSKELNDSYSIKSCVPILRKCDLTKPIMVNGKEEIPIVELAKIATNIEEFLQEPHYNYDLKQLEITGRRNYKLIFTYDVNDNSFVMMSNGFSKTVSNQLTLFEYMYSRMFDLKGLIEKGLAVDSDTLEINPYA